MNAADYQDRVYEGYLRRHEIHLKKSKDYAGEDVLSNFKRVAETCRRLNVNVQTPEGVALFFTVHKLDRLAKLIGEGATPANESLADNRDDLIQYVELLDAILAEKDAPKLLASDKVYHEEAPKHIHLWKTASFNNLAANRLKCVKCGCDIYDEFPGCNGWKLDHRKLILTLLYNGTEFIHREISGNSTDGYTLKEAP